MSPTGQALELPLRAEVGEPMVFGLMITREDHRLFADWCDDQLALYDAVVCLDGSESNTTREIAEHYADQLIYLHERDFTIPHKTDHGLRRIVHHEITQRFGAGHWIMCCHADEFCYHDPRKIAREAEVAGFDLVSWFSPHFYPHSDELPDWRQHRDLPIYERFRHYHWSFQGDGLPWLEDRLYRAHPGVDWDEQTHGNVRPHGLQNHAPIHPILRHYKVAEIDPDAFEREERCAHYRQHWMDLEHRTGLPFPVRRCEDLFVSAIPRYAECSRFGGIFNHPWNIGEQYRPKPVLHSSSPIWIDADLSDRPNGQLGGELSRTSESGLASSQLHVRCTRPTTATRPDERRMRVAILSLLFNWPSTGGGIVHTVELADFLSRAGYDVRHIFARYEPWGIGRVDAPTPVAGEALEFTSADWSADTVRARFRAALDRFAPDKVIITDSWNGKVLLAEAAAGYQYLLRLQALECLCPLNNVRLLMQPDGTARQCNFHQFATPEQCRRCLRDHAPFSGGLHRAERSLAGTEEVGYYERLLSAFGNAEAVLVVNPLTEAMLAPYARRVCVVTAGMDPARFPAPSRADHQGPAELFFAGLVEEWMKGFRVLHQACARLWRTRQDFRLVATGDPPGDVDAFTQFVGWQSQQDLPGQMHNADIVVIPTIAQEALGRTAVEAMAASRPVVASRIGGLPFTVADGLTGLLAEPGDALDLARKLGILLDDPDLRWRMGQAGRRRFEEEYAWEVIVRKHYLPLLGSPVVGNQGDRGDRND